MIMRLVMSMQNPRTYGKVTLCGEKNFIDFSVAVQLSVQNHLEICTKARFYHLLGAREGKKKTLFYGTKNQQKSKKLARFFVVFWVTKLVHRKVATAVVEEKKKAVLVLSAEQKKSGPAETNVVR